MHLDRARADVQRAGDFLGRHALGHEVHDLAFNTEKKLLREIQLFDVYTGDKLPSGKKSYAVSFCLLNPEKTLTDKQIDAAMKRLQSRFEKELGAELR